MSNKEDFLSWQFKLKENVSLEGEDPMLLVIPQNHPIQGFFRKIRVKVPDKKTIELDDFGRVLLPLIAQGETVEAMATKLDETFGQAAHPLYERLMPYLRYLDYELKAIEQVKE